MSNAYHCFLDIDMGILWTVLFNRGVYVVVHQCRLNSSFLVCYLIGRRITMQKKSHGAV